MIVGGKRFEISYDDYIFAALILYIDIIRLFLYILAMLGRK
jgi:FtsH-binding integral membrane protein